MGLRPVLKCAGTLSGTRVLHTTSPAMREVRRQSESRDGSMQGWKGGDGAAEMRGFSP